MDKIPALTGSLAIIAIITMVELPDIFGNSSEFWKHFRLLPDFYPVEWDPAIYGSSGAVRL